MEGYTIEKKTTFQTIFNQIIFKGAIEDPDDMISSLWSYRLF